MAAQDEPRFQHLRINVVLQATAPDEARYLHLYPNVVPGVPLPETQNRYSHLYVNVLDAPPCPWLISMVEDIGTVNQVVTLTGVGFDPAGWDTDNEVRFYDSQDLSGAYVVGAVQSVTDTELIVTVPAGATNPSWVQLVPSGNDLPPCTGSNVLQVAIAPFQPIAADPVAGWWFEVWNLTNTVKLIDGVPTLEGSVQGVLNDVGDGSLTLPADYERIRDICDPATNTVTLVKLYVDGLYRYSFYADHISDPYGEDASRVVTIAGRGLESVMEWARLFPHDYDHANPTDPIVAPDWNYGYALSFFEGFTDELEDSTPDWKPRNGGSIDENGYVSPAGVHSGVQRSYQVEAGAQILWTMEVQGDSIGQRITIGLNTGGDNSDVLSANTFVYHGEYLSELGNVPKNPAGNGCPGGETDGTWQTVECSVLLPSSVDSFTAFVQSDHHGACGAPGNDPFTIRNVVMSTLGVGVPDGWTAARASEFYVTEDCGKDEGNGLRLVSDGTGVTYTTVEVAVQVGMPTTFIVEGGVDGDWRIELVDPEGTGLLAGTSSEAGNDEWQTRTLVWKPTVERVLFRAVMGGGQGNVAGCFDNFAIATGLAPTTPGGILLDMIAAAQARGTIPHLKVDFSRTNDSDGNLWTNTAVSMNFGYGQTLVEVLAQLVAMGFEWEVQPQFSTIGGDLEVVLSLFNGRAVADGYGVGEHQRDTKGAEAAAILEGQIIIAADSTQGVPSSVVFGEGAEQADGIIVTAVTDVDAVSAYGRREDFFTNDQALDVATLSDTASIRLRNLRIGTTAAAVELLEDSAFRPWLDFRIGDSIRGDLSARLPDGWYRVARIAASMAGEDIDITYVTDLGGVIVPEAAVVAVTLSRLLDLANATVRPGTGTSTDATSGSGGSPVIEIPGGTEKHTHPPEDIVPSSLSGDLAGTLPAPTVVKLQGRDVATDVPANANALVWDDNNKVWLPDDRMNFRGAFDSGETYDAGDTVVEGDWTMVALVETNDPAAPQPVGSPIWLVDDIPTWVDKTSGVTTQIILGTRYEYTEGAWETGIRIWSDGDPDSTYELWEVQDPLNNPQYRQLMGERVLTQVDEWVEFPVGTVVRPTGSVVDYVLVKRQRLGSSTFVGDWDYSTPQPAASTPSTGEIVHPNQAQDVMRVHKTDNNAGDRSAELATVNPGDLITAEGTVWTVQSSSDEGTYFEFVMAPPIQLLDGLKVFTFEVFAEQTIPYVQQDNVYGTPVSGVEAQGFYQEGSYTPLYDVQILALDNNARGLDVQFQPAEVSPDWGFLAYSGGSAGSGSDSGGGGATELDELTDVDVSTTPPLDGEGLVFDDGSGLWVPGAGGGGGAEELDDLSDVDTTGKADQDVLTYVTGVEGPETPVAPDAVTASTTYTTYAPSRTVDGNLSTFWWSSGAASSNWIRFDMLVARRLTRIVLTHNEGDKPTSLTIEGSTDDSIWNTVVASTSSVAGEVQHTFAGVEYRYWRVRGTGGSNWWKMNEAVFYEALVSDGWIAQAVPGLPPGTQEGQIILWDNTGGQWLAVPPLLDTLADVDTTTLPPTDTQLLGWNDTAQLWVPVDAPTGGGGLPDGGTTGQHLTKTTDDDGDAEWTDVPAGGGSGGSAQWEDFTPTVKAGATTLTGSWAGKFLVLGPITLWTLEGTASGGATGVISITDLPTELQDARTRVAENPWQIGTGRWEDEGAGHYMVSVRPASATDWRLVKYPDYLDLSVTVGSSPGDGMALEGFIVNSLTEETVGGGGSGLPDGGTTGQHLTKASDDDGDGEWTDVPAGGGSGAPAVEYSASASAVDAGSAARTLVLLDCGTPDEGMFRLDASYWADNETGGSLILDASDDGGATWTTLQSVATHHIADTYGRLIGWFDYDPANGELHARLRWSGEGGSITFGLAGDARWSRRVVATGPLDNGGGISGGGGDGLAESTTVELTDDTAGTLNNIEQWGTEEVRLPEFDGQDVRFIASLTGDLKWQDTTSDVVGVAISYSLDDGATWTQSELPLLTPPVGSVTNNSRWPIAVSHADSGAVTTALVVRAMLYQANGTNHIFERGSLSVLAVVPGGAAEGGGSGLPDGTADGDILVWDEGAAGALLDRSAWVASASSFYNDTVKPENAIDGLPTTIWHSLTGGVGEWLSVDTVTAEPVGSVEITVGTDHGGYPVQVQYSDDEAVWGAFGAQFNMPADGSTVVVTDTAVTARYWRMLAVTAASSYLLVDEFHLRAAPDAAWVPEQPSGDAGPTVLPVVGVGDAVVQAGSVPYHATEAKTLLRIRGTAGDAPAGGDFEFDVLLDGVSVFSTLPTITDATNIGAWAVPDTTAWAADAALTVDVTAANGAANIVVQIEME